METKTKLTEKTIYNPIDAAKFYIYKLMFNGKTIELDISRIRVMETVDFTVEIKDNDVIVSRFYGVNINERIPVNTLKKLVLKEIVEDISKTL